MEIPDNLKNAIIAAEDGDFFEHSGVEITSLMRALYGEISGRSLGGGGTITMQVVRNYVLSFERTYERKLKEIFLAWRLEDYLNKEECNYLMVEAGSKINTSFITSKLIDELIFYVAPTTLGENKINFTELMEWVQ